MAKRRGSMMCKLELICVQWAVNVDKKTGQKKTRTAEQKKNARLIAKITLIKFCSTNNRISIIAVFAATLIGNTI